MPHRIIHPTKEQVRAYMARRESASLPPPAPEAIRRELGWRLQRADEEHLLLQFYLIPTTYTQLATRITLDLLLAPLSQTTLSFCTAQKLFEKQCDFV